MRHLLFLPLVGLLLVGASGCGGGDETASNNPPPTGAAGVSGMGSAAGVDMGDGGGGGYDGGYGPSEEEGYDDGYGEEDSGDGYDGGYGEEYSGDGYDEGYDGGYGEEMGYEDYDGGGYDDYSGGYPGEGRSGYPPNGAQQQAAGGGLLGSLGLGGLFGGSPDTAAGPTLAQAAQQAFQTGRDKDAMDLWYASILIGEDAGEETLKSMRWINGLKQPGLAVRWGIGIVYSSPRRYEGDPHPFGTRQGLAIRGASGGGGSESYGSESYGSESWGSEGGAAGPMSRGSHPELTRYTGDMAKTTIAAFKTRIDNGDFGIVLKDAAQQTGVGPGNRPNNNFAGYDAGYDSGYDAGYGDEGYGADYGYEPDMESGYEEYDGGSDAGYSSGYPGAPAASGQNQPVQLPDPGAEQLLPGLSYLGLGNVQELLQKAKEQDLQILFIFDVQVESPAPNPKTGIVRTNTSIDLYDVQAGKKVHATGELANTTVQLQREAPRFQTRDDPVEKFVGEVFAVVDERYKMVPMPAGLNAQHTLTRVTALVSSQYENPLPVLTEISYYNSRDLLSDELMRKAYEHLLGKDPGKSLAQGDEDDKREAIEQWIPAH